MERTLSATLIVFVLFLCGSLSTDNVLYLHVHAREREIESAREREMKCACRCAYMATVGYMHVPKCTREKRSQAWVSSEIYIFKKLKKKSSCMYRMKWNLVLHLRNLGKPCRRKRHVHRTGNEMKRVEKQKANTCGRV